MNLATAVEDRGCRRWPQSVTKVVAKVNGFSERPLTGLRSREARGAEDLTVECQPDHSRCRLREIELTEVVLTAQLNMAANDSERSLTQQKIH